ncbi:MAG: replication initiator protein A [Lachnospiraceae bacterium]|nr:replication initiator protein A [Lachnospiraceae bacterium]
MIKKERYFHASDVVRAEFYQFYAVLLDSPTYAELSNDSRVLYAVLQKRLQLSMKNGWLDEEGRTYFYFTRDELAKTIRVSEKTGRKAVKQLLDAELLHEVRQGRGKPNRLYLIKPNIHTEAYSGQEPRPQSDDFKNGRIYQSRTVKITTQDRQNLPPNKNDINKNDNSLYPSSSSPLPSETQSMMEEDVRTRIDYHSFSGEDLQIVDDVVSTCLRIDSCKNHTLRIGSTWINARQAKEVFSKINRAAVEHTIAAVKSADKITHYRAYLESVLYNYLSTPAASSSQKQIQRPRNGFNDFEQRVYSDDLLKQIMEAQRQ